jgi:transposase
MVEASEAHSRCKEGAAVNKHTSPLTIGVDVSDKESQFCFLDASGCIVREGKYRTDQLGVRKAVAKVPPSRIVLEAGVHSPWISELLRELGHEVIVADPRRLKLISASITKNDRNDAEMLARLARSDLKLLKPVQHRSGKAQAALRVLKVRGALVRSRTQFVNAVRGLAKVEGERIRKCDTDRFHLVARECLSADMAKDMEPLLSAIEELNAKIAHQDKALDSLAEQYPDSKHLDEVYGVGTVTSLAFILTLDDKTRFKSSRSVGPYLGLVPRQDQSGDTNKQLHITKAGDRQLRTLLVGAAQTILRSKAPDSDLKRWGMKLASRGGKNAKRRAVTAVARKLGVLLHRLWVTGEVYDPLYNARKKGALMPKTSR